MAEIGKSLVFYLKYCPEMNRLYEEERIFPEIDRRPDRDLILKKVNDVGHAASAEAADLLESCISGLKKRLETANVAKFRFQGRKTWERNWGLEIDVWPTNQRKSGKITRQIGIYLEREGLLPWVWSRGGMAVEDKIRSFFSKEVESYGSRRYPEWMSGSVGLATIPVPWKSAKDFTLDADGIIEQTQNVFDKAITPAFIEKFISRL